MMGRGGFELVLDGTFARPLSTRPTRIGRALDNDLVLSDTSVSAHHAAVWSDGAHVYVQDFGSRNGVYVNDVRVTDMAVVAASDRLRVGETALVLRIGEAAPRDPAEGLVLEDMASGLRSALSRDRLRLGDAPGVDLRVPGAAEVVLFVLEDGELVLGIDDDTRSLAPGEPFLVGDRLFVVRRERGAPHVTRDLAAAAARCALDATLEGGPGPRAVFTERGTARSHVIGAENRATLLWFLARQRAEDLEAGRPDGEIGWCPEATAVTSVWGRGAGGTPANLRVLLCRIRRELREADFDPWFLEHRSGHVRLAGLDVTVR